jgi:hypothetical protein
MAAVGMASRPVITAASARMRFIPFLSLVPVVKRNVIGECQSAA